MASTPGEPEIRRVKAAETVARSVVQTMVAGKLLPGDMLPGEAAMVEQYGVGRETLREALRLLEVQGLITIRRGPGGGPVVGYARAVNLGRIATLYYQMVGATYTELFEAWAFSEGILAARAARNPDDELRARVMAPYRDAAALEASEATEATIPGFIHTHAGFHFAVGSLAGNRVLELSMLTFGQVVSYQVGVIEDPRILRTLIYEHHDELARAIVGGNHNRARELMQEHIEHMWSYCRVQLGDRTDDAIEWL